VRDGVGRAGAGCLGRRPRGVGRPTRESFGTTADGAPIDVYTLMNAHGVGARVSDYGATVR
jgi:hypothetical protein